MSDVRISISGSHTEFPEAQLPRCALPICWAWSWPGLSLRWRGEISYGWMLMSSLDLTMRWSSHNTGGEDILPVLLMDNHIVKEMTMFWAWVLPGGLEPVLHMEDGVSNDQLVLCTEGEESEPVMVHFPHTMLANDFTAYQVVRTQECAMSSVFHWCW